MNLRLDEQVFLLDEEAWRVFDEVLQHAPAKDVAGLRELLGRPTMLGQ